MSRKPVNHSELFFWESWRLRVIVRGSEWVFALGPGVCEWEREL